MSDLIERVALRKKGAMMLFKWSREDFEEITLSSADALLEWESMSADGREPWYIRFDAILSLLAAPAPALDNAEAWARSQQAADDQRRKYLEEHPPARDKLREADRRLVAARIVGACSANVPQGEKIDYVADQLDTLAPYPEPSGELVERVAREMHRIWGHTPNWEHEEPKAQEYYRDVAARLCRLMENAGIMAGENAIAQETALILELREEISNLKAALARDGREKV